MSFQNKDLIENSYEEYDELSSKGFTGRKLHMSNLYEDFPSSQKLPNSVQEFLLRSDQIQEDIRRFNDTSSDKGQKVHQKINSKLRQLGFSIEITQKTSNESLLEIFEEALNELIYACTKLEEAETTCKELNAKCKSEDREIKTNRILTEFEYASNDSNLEELFTEIMGRGYNISNGEDMNIITFIKYAESQRAKMIQKIEEFNAEKDLLQNSLQELQYKNKDLANKLKKLSQSTENNEKIKVLNQVCSELSLKKFTELPEAIHKFQQVMFALPGVEKFVADVSEEFIAEHQCQKLEEIVPLIKTQKKVLNECEEFKKRVFQAFGSEKLKDIINFGRGLSHFCKLFEVSSSEKLLGVVEELFYFVKQIKGFISYFRRKLGMSESSHLKEILEGIISNFEKKN